MSEFLKGNFQVKRPVKETSVEGGDKKSLKEEFRRKALSSVGGSMVFVEMDQMMWDGDVPSETSK